ncbi:hypothetical protein PHYBLDRAFT_175333 [Phycomyces blakesleeanus NRRL 1555(-)]|uniref:Uncharacterized protein n=1 Tax=Phycomyces blakesleeanus (strain ATCC 8743b / DSM 1359 / FGSC 10004 / NBRC 33097 / NRRL 1555) TaxID=763407 RepID=A0A167JM01_PHYB8|nr:hypothetical protein PHYBLDRAFT_175333 [Phycomyces blakesleeanus NRRL 1555(-)]OAD66278.1 hypothetical protein PHYBLDRAFT_175333 [Phycomyces blakesleeanus NRRL 1555(-)]|eukprot:XP_018284318.1 hypothetical protein PHYBLDRAFT_175333 [Phycomyces blakesleeanus NRRL 1555(-)]
MAVKGKSTDYEQWFLFCHTAIFLSEDINTVKFAELILLWQSYLHSSCVYKEKAYVRTYLFPIVTSLKSSTIINTIILNSSNVKNDLVDPSLEGIQTLPLNTAVAVKASEW